jgi:hypothetical protein
VLGHDHDAQLALLVHAGRRTDDAGDGHEIGGVTILHCRHRADGGTRHAEFGPPLMAPESELGASGLPWSLLQPARNSAIDATASVPSSISRRGEENRDM